MGYNIKDILDKAILISSKRKAEYKAITDKKADEPSIKVMSLVLTRQEDKTIKYYEKLKGSLNDRDLEEIDFGVYDKMSFLINEFNNRTYESNINNVQDYLKFLIHMQKDVYSLLVDIQGRYVRDIKDTDTNTYKILSKIIKNKEEEIGALERTIK